MSLIRLLPAWLHAIADYAVGGSLIVVAALVGGVWLGADDGSLARWPLVLLAAWAVLIAVQLLRQRARNRHTSGTPTGRRLE